MQCVVALQAAGAKDLRLEQFMIYKERKPIEAKTETELERKLMRIDGGGARV